MNSLIENAAQILILLPGGIIILNSLAHKIIQDSVPVQLALSSAFRSTKQIKFNLIDSNFQMIEHEIQIKYDYEFMIEITYLYT